MQKKIRKIITIIKKKKTNKRSNKIKYKE